MRRLGTFTATMEAGGGDEWSAFMDAVRSTQTTPPLFDVTVRTRKRLAPVLVVRRRGACGRSHLRERFDRQTTMLRSCAVVLSEAA